MAKQNERDLPLDDEGDGEGQEEIAAGEEPDFSDIPETDDDAESAPPPPPEPPRYQQKHVGDQMAREMERLETADWRAPRGKKTKAIAWVIIIVFGGCALASIVLLIVSMLVDRQ